MKVNQILDEMQASLTKLRGHYRKTETAGSKPLEPCYNYPHRINKAIIDSGGYPEPEILDEIAKLREKLGKCVCRHSMLDCPLCKRQMSVAREAREKFEEGLRKTAGECICGANRQVDCPACGSPDLPLHARVAKALGLNPFFDYVGWCSIEKARKENLGAWCYATESHRSNLIPDYPNDLVAAMGVLEEYCRKENMYFEIHKMREQYDYDKEGCWLVYFMGGKEYGRCRSCPQAICEAIVAHAEGK